MDLSKDRRSTLIKLERILIDPAGAPPPSARAVEFRGQERRRDAGGLRPEASPAHRIDPGELLGKMHHEGNQQLLAVHRGADLRREKAEQEESVTTVKARALGVLLHCRETSAVQQVWDKMTAVNH